MRRRCLRVIAPLCGLIQEQSASGYAPLLLRQRDLRLHRPDGLRLRDLLVDAIRQALAPEAKNRLFQKVDDAVDVESIERLVAARKLTSKGMGPNAVATIPEEMERAQARRLQPHFIGAFLRVSAGFPHQPAYVRRFAQR